MPAIASAPEPVEAYVYSTMPSTAAHRPEMAMDGDTTTYFKSGGGMGDGDDFIIMLSRPIPIQTIHIETGDDDQQDALTNGVMDLSSDQVNYFQTVSFDSSGTANASLRGKSVQCIRIRMKQGQSTNSLVVREITIKSPVKIDDVMIGPGRGFIDISQAPDLAVWSQEAEKKMEEFWPDTAALLYSYKFITPNMVNVVYRTGPDVTGVAATGGGVMTVNSQYCRQHPDDTGLTVHETAHVIQAYSSYNPVWLVEGIADYIRWIKFEPENYHPNINVKTATYHDSYRTTAAFLGWCELHYDSRLVTKLNQAVRFGTYKNALFQQYCGKDVDTLWAEFVAAYKIDPANIVTLPVAAADRPRLLPVVTPDSSVPVDLTAIYNTIGATTDGSVFDASGGADGGGAAYSSNLLGSDMSWKNVQFRIGTPGQSNLVTCRGQIVPLAVGKYASLWLLGAAFQGSQMDQLLKVTYTDGSVENLNQNFSDWYQAQDFPGESRGLVMKYRNMATGTKDNRPFNAYSYGFSLDDSKTVQSLTLPNNENIKLLAVTLAK